MSDRPTQERIVYYFTSLTWRKITLRYGVLSEKSLDGNVKKNIAVVDSKVHQCCIESYISSHLIYLTPQNTSRDKRRSFSIYAWVWVQQSVTLNTIVLHKSPSALLVHNLSFKMLRPSPRPCIDRIHRTKSVLKPSFYETRAELHWTGRTYLE
jgi:hypothetical protein